MLMLSSQSMAEAGQHKLGENSIFSERAIKERLRPDAKVCLAGGPCAGNQPGVTVAASSDSAPKSPADIYQTNCSACHASGAAGAPKIGDAAAWEARMEKGLAKVVEIAIKGQGAMPPKGMCSSCSDDDIKKVVQYMLQESGLEVEGAGESSSVSSDNSAAAEEMSASSADSGVNGEEVYTQRCSVCHGQGIAGAPKVGDSDSWAPRLEKGKDTLVQNAIKGFGAMPPKGTCNDCSDEMIKAAVEHMMTSSQ